MAQPDEIKNLIKKVGQDPTILDSLLNAGTPGHRKQLLRGHAGQEFSRQEVAEKVRDLLAKSTAGGGGVPSAARPVEWIGAIATVVAGALAA